MNEAAFGKRGFLQVKVRGLPTPPPLFAFDGTEACVLIGENFKEVYIRQSVLIVANVK